MPFSNTLTPTFVVRPGCHSYFHICTHIHSHTFTQTLSSTCFSHTHIHNKQNTHSPFHSSCFQLLTSQNAYLTTSSHSSSFHLLTSGISTVHPWDSWTFVLTTLSHYYLIRNHLFFINICLSLPFPSFNSFALITGTSLYITFIDILNLELMEYILHIHIDHSVLILPPIPSVVMQKVPLIPS